MKRVVILGGGVAGMSAAHELIERGYAVDVYEKNPVYVGGKARSINHGGPKDQYTHNPLPGEHGFRFFPGFYKHVIDTMRRIPFSDSQSNKTATVFNNLTATERIMVARYGKEPIVLTASFPKNLDDVKLLIKDMHGTDTGLTQEQEDLFAERMWQLMTSCTDRRNFSLERLGWWEYLEADRFPGKDGKPSPYQSLLVQGLTRTLVAARAETASTKTGGNIFLQLIYNMIDPAVDTDRVLNGPTNDKWLNPWKAYLKSKGVNYVHEATATEINLEKDYCISGITVEMGDGTKKEVTGDHYILAVPIERAAELINDKMTQFDNTLNYIKDLAPSVSWMNGIQYFLNEDVQINKGHVIYSDSEWAITSISQVQFWKDYDITKKGDGKVKGVLSVDISDWFSVGRVNKKHADDCTREEVAAEVWEQLKASLNVNGKEVLKDSMIVDYYLDRAIVQSDLKSVQDKKANMETNREPLLVNNVNTWGLRPNSNCRIPNLFFASDYVRTFTDLATMEGANEAARRAVNCILDKDGSNAAKCKLWQLHEPPYFIPLKWYDKKRLNKGLPWTMNVPWWLKAFMVPWVIGCTALGFAQLLIKRIKGIFS